MLGQDWIHNYERMFRSKRFESHDIEAARRHIAAITFGRCNFTVAKKPRSFAFDYAETHLGRLSFQFLRWSAESNCETSVCRGPDHHLTLHIPVRGYFEARHKSMSARVDPNHMLLVSSSGTTQRHWAGDCDLLTITVPREPIKRLLRTEFAVENCDELEFEGMPIIDLRQQATLFKFLDVLLTDLSSESALFGQPIMGRIAESTLLMLLLKVLPHQFRDDLSEGRSCLAPYYVTRAERYMKQNLASNITISDLVKVSRVSDRSLHYGFKKYRQMSPMKYLKRLKMTAARDMLVEAPRPAMRVTEVANRFGYNNLSHFSRDYKAFVGESPVDTLHHHEMASNS